MTRKKRSFSLSVLFLFFALALLPASAQDTPKESPKNELEGISSKELLSMLRDKILSLQEELNYITRQSEELNKQIETLQTAQKMQEVERTKLSESLTNLYAEKAVLEAERTRLQKNIITQRAIIIGLVILCAFSIVVR